MRRAAPFLASALALFACRSVVPLTPLPAADSRPRALLEGWSAHAGGRETLRGRLRLAVDAGQAEEALRIRSQQVFALARPSSLRVEVLGFLNTTVAVLTTDGERYALLRAEDRSFEAGEIRDGLLWDVARLALTPAEVVDLLLGLPDAAAGLDVTGAYDAGDGRIRIALSGDGRLKRQVEFDREGRLRWVEMLDANGAIAWRARFDDYAPLGGAPFAHTLSLHVDDGAVAQLTLRDVELNPKLSPGIFEMQPPAESDSGIKNREHSFRAGRAHPAARLPGN